MRMYFVFASKSFGLPIMQLVMARASEGLLSTRKEVRGPVPPTGAEGPPPGFIGVAGTDGSSGAAGPEELFPLPKKDIVCSVERPQPLRQEARVPVSEENFPLEKQKRIIESCKAPDTKSSLAGQSRVRLDSTDSRSLTDNLS
jgi:hypothetical protein